MAISGGCLCGKTGYEISGRLVNASHCHCSMCRRQHGAAFATYAQFDPGDFRWTSGEEFIKVFQPAAGWCFCGECGSSLAGTVNGKVTSITLGTVIGDPGIRPECHIFASSKAPWHEITGNLPQFEERPPEIWKPPGKQSDELGGKMNPEERLMSVAEAHGFNALSNFKLLQASAAVIEILFEREVVRSSNNPVADYTEWLVGRALGLKQATKSNLGYDSTGPDGVRYEIKSRRLTPRNTSVQLSAIRGLAKRHFDFLVGVVFEADYYIKYAAKIPHALIEPNSKFREHTNAHVFLLRPEVLKLPGVEDLTDLLRKQQEQEAENESSDPMTG